MTAPELAAPPRRALVTGAGGFIGRHLVAALRHAGHDVVRLARAGSAPAGFDVLVTEDFGCDSLRSALTGRQFDLVFHLAAYGVRPDERDPSAMMSINVMASAALAEHAARTGAGFVMAGSWAEYGETNAGEAVAETAPLQTSKLYGASKAAATIAVSGVTSHLGGRGAVLRLFQVYGVGEPDHRLLSALVRRLSANETVPMSPGEQRRDFVYVADVVSAFRRAADWVLAQPAGTAGVFNVARGRATSVRDFARTLCELMGADPALLQFGALPYRSDDLMEMTGDPARFEAATGWRPRFALRDGLRDVLEAIRKEQCCPNS